MLIDFILPPPPKKSETNFVNSVQFGLIEYGDRTHKTQKCKFYCRSGDRKIKTKTNFLAVAVLTIQPLTDSTIFCHVVERILKCFLA